MNSMNYHNDNYNNFRHREHLNNDHDDVRYPGNNDDTFSTSYGDSAESADATVWLDEATDPTDNNKINNINKLHTLRRPHNPIVVLPVFVLSDLHTHTQTKSAKSGILNSHLTLPIQPLLNKDKVRHYYSIIFTITL